MAVHKASTDGVKIILWPITVLEVFLIYKQSCFCLFANEESETFKFKGGINVLFNRSCQQTQWDVEILTVYVLNFNNYPEIP